MRNLVAGEMADGDEHCPMVQEVLNLLPQIPAANDAVMSQVMTAIGIFAEKTSGQHVGPLGGFRGNLR